MEMYNLFLFGDVGIGKSTLLKKVLKYVDSSIGGFMEEKVLKGDKTFHNMISLYDGQSNNIIGVSEKTCKKPKVFTYVFEKNGVEILKKSYREKEIIIMDELGFLESHCELFKSSVNEILDSKKIVIGVLKKCNCDFVTTIANRTDVVLLEVTTETRDNLEKEIFKILKGFNVNLKS